MKKKEQKTLEEKLLAAIKKVIQGNKTDLTKKIEKAVKKSIKKIVKKTNKKKKSVSQKKTRNKKVVQS